MYLGIDCGGTHLRLGLVDQNGQILAYSRIKSPLVSSPDKFGQIVFAEYQKILTDNTLNLTSGIEAIGIGVPGPIDRDSGSILHSANLHNDSPIHFVKQLQSSFALSATSDQKPASSQELPIFFDRDAEVALFGEYWLGAAKDCQNCLLLTLGTGIGGAIMTEGKVVTGVTDNAGEIGHMYLSVASSSTSTSQVPTCGLGHQGCFEAWLKHANPEDKPFILGTGLASLVNIFNPAKIILGGGMIEYNEVDLDEAISVMQDKAVAPLGVQTEVVRAKLGDKAGVVGAVYLCLFPQQKTRPVNKD